MPFFSQQWGELLKCAVCTGRFDLIRLPCSLICTHTICVACLASFRDGNVTKCPLDQTDQKLAIGLLPVNTAMLELLQLDHQHCPAVQDRLRICMKIFREESWRRDYLFGLEKLEKLAAVVISTEVLNKPLQRKLMTLFQCQILLEEGRTRSLKAARSVCERIVIELILQHQNQQQLTIHLWSAVRARGCQFLGPAMQEEVLKLVLLALESGSALSRKVLVMFIVQKLKAQYPQASKTSVGHVVQLLYRASCFKVCKRDGDSSLMELKEEFRTYEALRREHDAQVIQIAQEAGLRIAPEQWSSLLYGDQQHKSPMQSIIDKLQTSQFFSQSIQELLIAIQRSGDPESLSCLSCLSEPLNFLADIDMSAADFPSIQLISSVLMNVLDILVAYLKFMATTHTSRDTSSHNRTSIRTKEEDLGGNGGYNFPSGGRSLLHQPLVATRSLPHNNLQKNMAAFGNHEVLAESLSVMDLNRTVYQTADHHTTMQMIRPSNSVSVQSPLSLSMGRPTFRQFSAPSQAQSPRSVPISPFSASTRLNIATGMPRQSNFGLSFMNPPTSGPRQEAAPDFAFYRQPVVASASWSDVCVPQRYSSGNAQSQMIPTSLSSGSLLEDYSKWRDDAATSNGIHRIASFSDNLQGLGLASYAQRNVTPFNESSFLISDEEPAVGASGSPPYPGPSSAQTVTNRHVLLGRR